MRLLSVLSLLLLAFSAQSQTTVLDREPSYPSGLNRLALVYYGIDFSKEQRKVLSERPVEFYFLIDTVGGYELAEINGIDDAAILDSLQQRTMQLSPFIPALEAGKPVEAFYILQMSFPKYGTTRQQTSLGNSGSYRRLRAEDFEYVERGKDHFSWMIGLGGSQFVGQATDYLGTGFGMLTDVRYTTQKEQIFGISINLFDQPLRQNLPIESNRPQGDNITGGIVAFSYGKWFQQFSIHAELGFSMQNVTPKLNNEDRDWVQLRGWSPGIVLNYPIQLGRDHISGYYLNPTIFTNNINLHAGLRYIDSPLPEVSGLLFEIGVGYQMMFYQVESFQLKNN
ncbi:MAG: hypothetical protein AAGI23_19155 [Bacteroidota bacterium]